MARPVDRVVGGYLVLSATALVFPDRPDAWLPLLVLHLVLAGLLLADGLAPARRALAAGGAWRRDASAPMGRRLAAALLDWYPLIGLPLLYMEIPVLNAAVWGGRYFDPAILGWEAAIFGGQPSATLATRWSSLPLSEILHFAYLSYFPILYFFPAYLYLVGRGAAFQRTLFAMLLGFGVHYLVFTFFPVHGPRYLFPGPGRPMSDGPLYRATHLLLESGSSKGAAFPSSHVALAAVQTGNALRFAPKAAPLIGLGTLGIALGAVYGGFHYGVDVVAGLVSGAVLALVMPRAWRLLR